MPSRKHRGWAGWVALAAFCDKVLLQLGQKFFGLFLSFLGRQKKPFASLKCQNVDISYCICIMIYLLGRFEGHMIPPRVKLDQSASLCLIGDFSGLSGCLTLSGWD